MVVFVEPVVAVFAGSRIAAESCHLPHKIATEALDLDLDSELGGVVL